MAKFYRYDTVEVKSDAKDKNGYYRDKAAIVGRSGLLKFRLDRFGHGCYLYL